MKQQMSKLIKTLEQKIPKIDNVTHCTHESVHVEQPSINKHVLGGFDSHKEDNHGWFPRGIYLQKVDMRKYDGKEPITWISRAML